MFYPIRIRPAKTDHCADGLRVTEFHQLQPSIKANVETDVTRILVRRAGDIL